MRTHLLLLSATLCLSASACSDSVAGSAAEADAEAQADIVDDSAAEAAADSEADPGPAPHTGPDASGCQSTPLWGAGEPMGGPLLPRVALRSLWAVWGDGTLFPSDADYWPKFRARYGFYEAPFDNDGLPLGIRDAGGGSATFTCTMCHASEVAGEVLIGAGNSLLDLEGLYDDLLALADLAEATGRFPELPLPPGLELLEGRTGAPGATDAMGLAMALSEVYAGVSGVIETDYGFQDAPAWWTIPLKSRLYTDGSGQVGGHRTMMSMLLAFGLSPSEFEDLDPTFEAIDACLSTLPAPAWPFEAPDAEARARGALIYEAECASCHDSGQVIPASEIGTDPTRAEAFGEAEAAWINASWFGAEAPMSATGGYFAPPLVGVWASAPYLHNGSVPDLASLLDPPARPVYWRRTGSSADDYDADRVGWRYEEAPAGARGVFDTTLPGLSAGGHTFGAALSPAERADLLAFLKGL